MRHVTFLAPDFLGAGAVQACAMVCVLMLSLRDIMAGCGRLASSQGSSEARNTGHLSRWSSQHSTARPGCRGTGCT